MSLIHRAAGLPRNIAVIGTGISGMAAAWLLARRHCVTVYDGAGRAGGHSHTVDVAGDDGAAIPVDTGFIVYNDTTYPNLTALFATLGVATAPSDMSFAVSLRNGGFEYGGGSLAALLAQPGNLARARFWAMLRDLRRFYARAPALLDDPDDAALTLGAYLDREGYSPAFAEDHLLPMAAAIWSAPLLAMRDCPAAAFIRFCANHGLLQLRGRPVWRHVVGGSRAYVHRLTAPYADRLRLDRPVRAVARRSGHVVVEDDHGGRDGFDAVVIATHADQALALLRDPSPVERSVLGALRYRSNAAVLHEDAGLMPRRRAAWSSWNYHGGGDAVAVTYWLNRLQSLPTRRRLFLTLNPVVEPRPDTVIDRFTYAHPSFDLAALAAQRRLWALQGRRGTWFCGAYFGAGFHEDGLQAGLAVAEALGGVRRPWQVPDESGRIGLDVAAREAAA